MKIIIFLIVATFLGITRAALDSRCPYRAVSVLKWGPLSHKNVTGAIELRQDGANDPLYMTGEIKGLQPNTTHAFHVHESGDFRNSQNPCLSTGAHFNPFRKQHGSPKASVHHMGDLGNLEADENGVAPVNKTSSDLSLVGPHSILGRAFVVHELRDDLGLREGESKQTGNPGPLIVCGLIGTINVQCPAVVEPNISDHC